MGVNWPGWMDTSHYHDVEQNLGTQEFYIDENGYRTATLDVTILPGVHTLTQSACDSRLEAWQYARDHFEIEPLDFDHRILVVPSGCPYAGSGGGGECTLSGGTGFPLLLHEFSHSLGLPHNGLYRCRDRNGMVIPFNPEGCDWRESADATSPNSRYHRSSLNKTYTGWLKPIDVTTSGIYRLDPYETPGGVKVLRVRGSYDRGGGPEDYYFYLSYRQSIGFDTGLDEQDGVVFHLGCWYYSSNTQRHCLSSTLLDMPGDGHYGLQAGRGWTDPAGIQFEVLAGNVRGPAGHIDVRITFPGPDPGACTVPNVVVAPGGVLPYRVTVRDPNGNPIPDVPVGITFSDSADAVLAWCPGQNHPVLSATTDRDGVATFAIAAGGCVETPAAEVWAAGVFLKRVGVVSPDVRSTDGSWAPDGVVDLSDAVFFTDPISTGRYVFAADLNSDGQIGPADAVALTVAIQRGATCGGGR
jgi:hypothetical protein